MSVKFRDTWTAFGKNFLQQVRDLKGKPYVKVGFPAPAFGKAHEGQPATVGEIAVFMEFGTETKDGGIHIPARPFIRPAFDENRRKLAAFKDKLLLEILNGKLTVAQGLEQLGLYHANQIVDKIDSNIPPPNDPKTIAAKGSSHTLIDSGQMRQTVISQGYEVHLGGNK
jgi:hypothetical protein